MTTIAEHTVDLSLLPKGANILDIGCRGFLFFDDLVRLGHKVVAIDVDRLETSRPYYRIAITGQNGYVDIKYSPDPQAVSVRQTFRMTDTESMTLSKFSETVGVPFWDLIKIDVEGSEYEIIMSLTEPPAKQLSIEFHLHTGIYGAREVKQMEDKLLSLGYFPAKHDKYPAHGLPANYWDSLFILVESWQ